MSDVPHVVSFSGGQTSGYMLHRLLYAARINPTTLFCNTGKEYNETLDFVRDVETRWFVPVTWLEYCRVNNEHSFRVVNYETAARRTDPRTPFDEMLEWAGTLPNVRGRGCSGQLKVRTMRRYLQSQGLTEWHSYIGIRADEAHRKLEVLSSCPKYITPHFPLCDEGTSKADVDAFWMAQPFRLNIPNHMGNCDLCYLKAKWKRLAIMRDDPEAAAWWIGWEKRFRDKGVTGVGAQWQEGVSYEALLHESEHPEFDFTEQVVPCSCAVGGYREESAE